MDDRLHDILTSTGRGDLDTVAAGVLGRNATVIGEPVRAAVSSHPNDPRTLGVVHVSGMAEIGGGGPAAWSAVAKVVDLAGSTIADAQWTRPEIEEIVYEEGYFAGDGQKFRPARCHLVSRPEDTIRVFWLEDLTGAEHAPFGVEQLSEMARHLGEWSGAHRDITRSEIRASPRRLSDPLGAASHRKSMREAPDVRSRGAAQILPRCIT